METKMANASKFGDGRKKAVVIALIVITAGLLILTSFMDIGQTSASPSPSSSGSSSGSGGSSSGGGSGSGGGSSGSGGSGGGWSYTSGYGV